jgi:L-rhamnose isomerase/sugar isomerase
MEDAALVHQLTVGTPRLSLHIPWDETQDLDEILTDARRLGIGFDAVNSNTFQDQPGQPLSYKFGSFSNPNAAVRRQAIEHHLRVIEIGKQVGSKALSVWLADGSNYPGQMSLRGSFERVRECLQEVYAAMPTMAAVHRAQAVRAGVLRHRRAGLGLVARARAVAR